MFSVEVDQSALQAAKRALYERLQRKIQGGCETAAAKLAQNYRDVLLSTQAPPHSNEGDIPHKYDGPRPGGYGSSTSFGGGGSSDFGDSDLSDVFGIQFDPSTNFGGLGEQSMKNNQPPEFSKVQGDDEYLATFITSGASEAGGVVGFTFENSHVTSREQNYLIHHDQGTVRQYPNKKRPWVDEIYDSAKPEMVVAFQNYLDTGGTDSVPF